MLVQVQHQAHIHLLLSEFVPALLARFGGTAVAFGKTMVPARGSIAGAAARKALGFWLGARSERIYRWLGCSAYLTPKISRRLVKQAKFDADTFLGSGPSKSDLELFEIDGIHIGDLIYDSFLRIGHPTIIFDDPGLRELLVEAGVQVRFWKKYLSSGVAAVVGDGAYIAAVALRVACHLSIPAYTLTPEAVYRLSAKTPLPYREDLFFESQAAQLLGPERDSALERGRVFLERRLAGAIDHRIPTLKASPYLPSQQHQIDLEPNEKVKILVAAHDFYDSPHIFGIGFFPDYWEWLSHVAELARLTDYQWVVKPHPVSSSAGVESVQALFQQIPNVTVVSQDSSTRELVRLGVKFAVTCSGSIAAELPALGVTVIHASANHRHPGFSFSLTPVDRAAYTQVLLSLADLKFKAKLDDMYLFHYFDGVVSQASGPVSHYWRATASFATQLGVAAHESYGPLGAEWRLAADHLKGSLAQFIKSNAYRTEPW